jgi:hypothetical protein
LMPDIDDDGEIDFIDPDAALRVATRSLGSP